MFIVVTALCCWLGWESSVVRGRQALLKELRSRPSVQVTLASQWSLASGLAFLAWYVFAPQCVATLGVVKRETNSWLWPTVMFAYMVALAYGAALVVYQGAKALGWA